MIAVCQDCSSPRKALIKCLPEHCWGAYIIVSKISAYHHFWWIPRSSSLWEGESISSIFISLDIGNNFGPWNIPRRTPAISKHRIFASFFVTTMKYLTSGSYLKKGLTFVYNSWDFSSGSDDPLLWSSGKHNKHSPPSVQWNKPIHHMNQRAKEGRDQGSTMSCKNTPPMTWEPPWYSAF